MWMDKGQGQVKNKDVRTIHIGMRKLDLIDGLTIKKYLPEGIMKYVHMAMDDQKMEWTDDTIEDCTMVVSESGICTVMYKYEPRRFNGLMLFSFTNEPQHDYRFSFTMKQFHIEYYTRTKY